MQSEILAIKERVKDLEEKANKNQAQIEDLIKGQSEFSKDVHSLRQLKKGASYGGSRRKGLQGSGGKNNRQNRKKQGENYRKHRQVK